MFNSSHVYIAGGNYSEIHNHRVTSGQDGFGILTKAAAPGAFHDSGQEFDAPRCHENTRVAVLEKIGDWVNLIIDFTTVIMWLYGAAGAGKTAIARTTAEKLHSQSRLLATFFFSRADPSRNHIRSVVPTLAYDITRSIPESRPLIATTIENDPHIFHHPFAYQLKHLIIEPLRQLSQQGVTYPTVIVIDGLDECLIDEERTTLLRSISTIAVQQSLRLKFLVTSRPEVPIERTFNTSPVIGVSTRHSLDDEPNSIEDIEYFLSAKFDEIKRTHPSRRHIPHDWPSYQLNADLVQNSSGQFIYPATVIRYISSPRHNPLLRLNVVLRLQLLSESGDLPFTQLDALYRHILLSCHEIDLALQIIGMCLLSSREFGTPWGRYYRFPSETTKPKYMEAFLRLDPGDVQRGLEDMGSLIGYRGDDEPLRILHASLFDFLTDSSRSSGIPFDLSAIYTKMAIWCIHPKGRRDKLLIYTLHPGTLFPLFYHSIIHARATDELKKRLQHMILPRPSLPVQEQRGHRQFDPEEMICYYPYFVESLTTMMKTFRHSIYWHHLTLYEEYVHGLIVLYERHCPGFSALLALIVMGHDLSRLFNWREDSWDDGSCFTLTPILHPQQLDAQSPTLISFAMLHILLRSGNHSTLGSAMGRIFSRIRRETIFSLLRYLQSGGHSNLKTRTSLKALLKPSYFKRLKLQPWLSRIRKRYGRSSISGDSIWVEQQHLHGWFHDNIPSLQSHSFRRILETKEVPGRSFNYRREYATNYDLWYTYRYALKILPLFLAQMLTNRELAAYAADCVFNSFCTAHRKETRNAKKAIARYVARCPPPRTRSRAIKDGMDVNRMDVGGMDADGMDVDGMDVDGVDVNGMDVD